MSHNTFSFKSNKKRKTRSEKYYAVKIKAFVSTPNMHNEEPKNKITLMWQNSWQKHWKLYKVDFFCLFIFNFYCWFSHDVTKFRTSELLILLRFYFHDVLEQLKTNIQTNFHSDWVLGLVIDYAWISKLLRDVAFTGRARELLCWFKRWLISGNSAIWTVLVLELSIIVTFMSS